VDLFPTGTISLVSMTIRPGGAGEGGWLRQSTTTDVQYLDSEFTVVDGPHARRKFWQNITMSGGALDDTGESIGGKINRALLRAAIECARNILPEDFSEAAMNARRVNDFGDLDGMRFLARIGVEKGKDGYADKNKVASVVTPDMKEYAAGMGSVHSATNAAPAPAGAPSWVDDARTPAGQPSNTPSWAT